MSKRKTTAGVLVMGLMLAWGAAPALAHGAKHHASGQNWRNARAQAVGGGLAPGGRNAALRDCSTEQSRRNEYTWGQQTDLQYRACMSERGQVE